MSAAARKNVRKKKISDSYLKLIMEFPLRPIRNDRDYDEAFAVIAKLAIRGEADLDQGEHDYLDALGDFATLYADRHFPFPSDTRTPLQRLQYLLTESGTTPGKLQKILGCSQPLVSMILSDRRELSKENIRALAAYFHIEAGYFL